MIAGMRSDLFGNNLETTSEESLSLQNPRMLKARLEGAELLARQGAMVAYQGQIDFAYEGAGGVGRFLKKALTGEGVPLMRCRGTSSRRTRTSCTSSTSTATTE
jgi:uncharacterized protein (AIM24 family)